MISLRYATLLRDVDHGPFSHVFEIAELLRRGAAVAAYDPLAVPSMRRVFPGIDYAASAADALRGADACLVMTEWPEFSGLNGEFDLMKSRVVIEGRRVLSCDGKEG
ncbi:UDP binding domain-containing protein, partial [Methanoculleus sp.]